MPLMRLKTTTPVPDEKQQALLASLSKIVAESIGKPEQYVMVTLETGPVMFAGQAGDAAFADVRSIGGLSGNVNTQISRKLRALLPAPLAIAPHRAFLNFTEITASHWGWNGSTFG